MALPLHHPPPPPSLSSQPSPRSVFPVTVRELVCNQAPHMLPNLRAKFTRLPCTLAPTHLPTRAHVPLPLPPCPFLCACVSALACLSIRPSGFSARLSVCFFVFVCPPIRSTCLLVCPFVSWLVGLLVLMFLFVCLSAFVPLSACACARLSVCPSIRLHGVFLTHRHIGGFRQLRMCGRLHKRWNQSPCDCCLALVDTQCHSLPLARSSISRHSVMVVARPGSSPPKWQPFAIWHKAPCSRSRTLDIACISGASWRCHRRCMRACCSAPSACCLARVRHIHSSGPPIGVCRIRQIRERERERETDRQGGREGERQTGRERERDRERETERHMERQRELAERESQTDRQSNRQTDRQAGRQADRDRQT